MRGGLSRSSRAPGARAGRGRRKCAAGACLTVALLAALAWLPAGALAAAGAASSTPVIPGASSPFSPVLPSSPAPTTTATTTVANQTTTSNDGAGGLNGTDAILIAIGAAVVLVGIAYFIWADARRHAPVRSGLAHPTTAGRSGSKAPIKPRKLSPAERRRRKRGRAR